MSEFMTLFLNNLVEFVLAAILAVITCLLLPWVKKTVIPFVKRTIVPWLKEKRLYTIVSRFVQAAEKYNKSHAIDKKQWVIGLLKDKGIDITPEVEAYIESAVQELDIAIDNTASAIYGDDEEAE